MIVKPALLAVFTVTAVASFVATPAAKMQDRLSPIASVATAPIAAQAGTPASAARGRRADRGDFSAREAGPAARTITVERRTGPNSSELVRVPAATAELR